MKRKLLAAFIVLVLTASCVPQALATDNGISEDGLLGYWSFDADDAQTVALSEVNTDKWDAYIGKAVTLSQNAMLGKGIRLQKSASRGDEEKYVSLGTVPEEIKTSQAFTFAGWINLTGNNWWSTIMSLTDPTGATQPRLWLEIENGKMKGISNGADEMNLDFSVNDNTWYFVTATVDVDNKHDMNVYINGERVGGRNISGRNVDFDLYELWIGGTYRDNSEAYESFNGYIDDVRIYDRVLTDGEIARLYYGYKATIEADDDEIKMYSYKKLSDNNYIDIKLASGTFVESINRTMFTAEGLPQGLRISAVTRLDDTTARIFFSGTSAEEIVEDKTFTVKAASRAANGACMDSEPVECVIKAPEKFAVLAEVLESENSLELTGKIVNTFNTTNSAVALIGVYDGAMLKNSVTTEIAELAKDGELNITNTFDVTGYENPGIKIFVWNELPAVDENGTIEGGKILADAYYYPELPEASEGAENSDIMIDVNSVEEKVTVSGQVMGKKASVMVYVQNQDGEEIDYFDEITVSEDGSFKHTYSLNNPQDDVPYNVFVTDENGSVIKSFKYYSADYRDEIFEDLKSKKGAGFINGVEEKQYVLDIDLSADGVYGKLSEQAKTDFWTELEKGVAICTSQPEFKTLFNKIAKEMTLTDAVNNAADTEALILLIEENNSEFNFNLNDDYEEYKEEIAEGLKKTVYHNLDEVSEGLETSFFTTVFNSIDYTDKTTMLKKLEKYKTQIGIKQTFFGLNKNTYVKYMMGKTYTSKNDLKIKTDEAIEWGNKIIGQSVSSSGRNPGGSSGGGSKNPSSFAAPAVVPNVKKEEMIDPIITAEEANAKFDDLDDVEWAKEAVEALADKQIVSGKAEKIFAPNDFVTRAEFAKMIVLAFGKLDEGLSTESFSDVSKDDWFYPYVANAESRQVIMGRGDGTFGVTELITREDMCVMVYRQLMALNKKLEASSQEFADSDKISEYAKEAVMSLKSAGVVNGVNDTDFAPEQNCTRAMAAKVIYTALNLQ